MIWKANLNKRFRNIFFCIRTTCPNLADAASRWSHHSNNVVVAGLQRILFAAQTPGPGRSEVFVSQSSDSRGSRVHTENTRCCGYTRQTRSFYVAGRFFNAIRYLFFNRDKIFQRHYYDKTFNIRKMSQRSLLEMSIFYVRKIECVRFGFWLVLLSGLICIGFKYYSQSVCHLTWLLY